MPAQLLGDISLNGYPGAASGSVRFYQPTTLIPVVVYSNDAATAAITQPIALDANGRSVTPIYVTKMVRMIIYDVNGAQLQDVERVDGMRAETTSLVNTSWPGAASEDAAWTALATSLGGTNGNFKASGTGSVARSIRSKLSEQFSVKDFGAIGNGIVDDTAAITATMAAASGGGVVSFPAGIYLISQTISVPGNGIIFQGSGRTSTFIRNSSTSGNAIASGSLLTSVSFLDLAIQALTSSTGVGISLGASSPSLTVTLMRVDISGHRSGVVITPSSQPLLASILDSTISCDGNAAAVCLSFNNSSSVVSLYGGSLFTGSNGFGSCVSCGSTGTLSLFGTSLTGGTGVASAGCNFAIVGGDVVTLSSLNLYSVSAGTPNITVIAPPASTNVPTNLQKSIFIAPYTGGAYGDAGPYITTNVGTTSAYAVTVTTYKNHRVVGTAAAITITMTAPGVAVAYQGALHTVIFANNSGGAVTWAFSAAYRSAAVAPATGNQVAVTYLCIDAATPIFVEVSRGSTVAI